MVSFKTIIRVRYADTDKMQFVYNGKYLEYFEVGRTEFLRNFGLPYKVVEDNGYQLPLVEAGVKFISAAFYDDLLEIESILDELPKPFVDIKYIIRRKDTEDVIVTGFTKHIFIKTETKKAVRPPKFYLDAISPYFK